MDQGSLERDVEEGAARLEVAAEALYDATIARGKAEVEYERARLKALANLHREYEEKRLPAQDVRDSLIFPLLSNEWDNFYVQKYTEEAMDKRYRALQHAVSARQSLLKARSSLG